MQGTILQVLLIAVLFGFALHRFGGRDTLVFDVIEKGLHVLFTIIGYLMKLAPIGAFAAMALAIGKHGVASLFSLGKLMAVFYMTCLLFIFVVLGAITRFHFHPATLSAVGTVPVAGLALILGIDRFMSGARALTSLVGNGVAPIVVAKWTGELDEARLQAGLDNETWIEAQEPEELINAKTEKMAT